jgi:hypothetical protein
MKTVFRLVLLVLLAALGWWLWTVMFPNEEAVIRKRLNRVATLMTFNSKEGTIARIANVEEVADLFDREVEIVVDTPAHSQQHVTGRDELRQNALGVRMALTGLTVKFLDLNVSIAPDRTNATVQLTGEARVPGDRDLFVQELKFELRKVEGKWLIVRVATVRTLT